MDSMHHDNDAFMPQISPPSLMNPPPQIFGAYTADGLPISPALPDLNGTIFGDGTLLDESNEAKRRRIARVGFNLLRRKMYKRTDEGRLVICAGRRRLSAMESSQLVRTASTTKQNVFLLRWKRRGTHQKESSRSHGKFVKALWLVPRIHKCFDLQWLTDNVSGLLSEEDGGRTDLGTLEKILQEKNLSRRASAVPGSNATSPTQSTPGGPADGNGATPLSAIASPEPNKGSEKRNSKGGTNGESEEKEEPVEALSDMMCSLVTNNCGETRYIGMEYCGMVVDSADKFRFLLWIFYIFAKGYLMGQRENRRLVLPGNDFIRFGGRQ
ncbi:hypothetical protein NHQ30_004674 [Ciborinia camelliae]|nr:hypothetical protein NHQ30_004674 [Ciborinia camelliae]